MAQRGFQELSLLLSVDIPCNKKRERKKRHVRLTLPWRHGCSTTMYLRRGAVGEPACAYCWIGRAGTHAAYLSSFLDCTRRFSTAVRAYTATALQENFWIFFLRVTRTGGILTIQITKCLGPSSGWARLLVGLADLPVWTRVMQPCGCLGRVHGRFHTNGKRIYSSVLLSVSQFSFFKKSKGCSYIHLRLLPYDMVFRRQVMLVNSTCCGAEPLLRGAQIQPQLIAAWAFFKYRMFIYLTYNTRPC